MCPNCQRPVAVPYSAHGCVAGQARCGSRGAACCCSDCVLDCLRLTVANLRTDIERYQRKFGALRPGIAESDPDTGADG